MESNTTTAQYLARINYTGSVEPTLEVLTALQKAHLMNVPFENLSVYYQTKVDFNHLYDKIVNQKRGGFCYELNWPFHQLLLHLGFEAKVVSARVYDPKNGFGAEFDHMVVIVTIGPSDYLVDVGFGEFSLAPVKIELHAEHTDPRGTFKIEAYDDTYKLIKRKNDKGEFLPVYIFSELKRELNEFSEMCTFHQTSPQSPFTHKRLVTMLVGEGRVTLTGDTLKTTINGTVTDKELSSEEEVKKVLTDIFNINM